MKHSHYLSFSFLLLFLTLGLTPLRSSTLNISSDSISKTSLFNHIYQMEGIPNIVITTDIKKLVEKKLDESYQAVAFEIKEQNAIQAISLKGEIRARGNMRKKVSHLPPVKLKFEEELLESLGFLSSNKLKFVFPNDDDAYFQELLLKEFLLYEIYNHIDPNYMRTKLVNVSIVWNGKEKYQFIGFLIEDNDEYKRRMNLNLIKKGVISCEALDQTCFSKMIIFQYMIANTDWSVAHKHNLELVKLADISNVVAMPYDFDFSGFVGHDYAIPHPLIPIKNVHQRFFYPHFKLDNTSFLQMMKYYLSIEKDVYNICDQATYMRPRTIKKSKAYLASFFDLLRDHENLKVAMVK